MAAASESALAWARASAAEVKGLNATSLTTWRRENGEREKGEEEVRATKDDGSLFLERQRRLAFYALILFPNAAEPSSGLKALSLFRSKEEISLCPPSLARDAAHSLGKTNTKEQTEEGINLTAASLRRSNDETPKNKMPLTFPNRSRSVTDSCTAGVDPPIASRPCASSRA